MLHAQTMPNTLVCAGVSRTLCVIHRITLSPSPPHVVLRRASCHAGHDRRLSFLEGRRGGPTPVASPSSLLSLSLSPPLLFFSSPTSLQSLQSLALFAFSRSLTTCARSSNSCHLSSERHSLSPHPLRRFHNTFLFKTTPLHYERTAHGCQSEMFKRRSPPRTIAPSGLKIASQAFRERQPPFPSSSRAATAMTTLDCGSTTSHSYRVQLEPLFHDDYISTLENQRPPEPEPAASSAAAFHQYLEHLAFTSVEQIRSEPEDDDLDENEIVEVATATIMSFNNPGPPKVIDIVPPILAEVRSSVQSPTRPSSGAQISTLHRARPASLESDYSTPSNTPQTPMTVDSNYSQYSAFTATVKEDSSIVYSRIDRMLPAKLSALDKDRLTNEHHSWSFFEDEETENALDTPWAHTILVQT